MGVFQQLRERLREKRKGMISSLDADDKEALGALLLVVGRAVADGHISAEEVEAIREAWQVLAKVRQNTPKEPKDG